MIEFEISPNPVLLIIAAILTLGFLGWSFHTNKNSLGAFKAGCVAALRFLVVALVLAFLHNPVRVDDETRVNPTHVALLVDASKSMSFESSGQTRLDEAKMWISERLKLPEGVELQTYGVHTNLFQTGLDALTAEGEDSALIQALKSLPTDSKELPGAVILISDGADRTGADVEEAALAYRSLEIPIFTVMVGESDSRADLIMEAAFIPSTLGDNALVPLKGKLRAPGFVGKSIPLRVTEGGRLVAEKRLRVDAEEMEFEFEFYPGRDGFRVFQVGVPPQPGERTGENNRLDFGLNVRDRTLRVLYMEGSGVQRGVCQPLYLKHALEEAEDIFVKVLHCDQYGSPPSMHAQIAFVDPKNGERIYRVQNPTLGYPRTLEGLLNFDVIICSDIPKEAFTGEQLEFTSRFVLEHGGGFVMIGGNTSFGSGGYDRTIIDRIIPVEMSQSTDSRSTIFSPEIPEEAWTHPIMRLGGDMEETKAIWLEKFPQLRGLNIVDYAKPGAVVLMRHPSLPARRGSAIVFAAQEVGRGRTLAFTSDTTYLWGQDFQTIWGERIDPSKPLAESNCDSRYYKQFWINAARWLSDNKFRAEESFLTASVDQTYYSLNTDIPVHIRIDRMESSPNVKKLHVEVLKDGNIVMANLEPQSVKPDEYRVVLNLDEPGAYRVRAVAETGAGKETEASALVHCQAGRWENGDGRCLPQLLDAMASLSGGKFLTASDDPGVIAGALEQTTVSAVEGVRKPIWDKGWWLVFLIGLLTAEWVIRRRSGLA